MFRDISALGYLPLRLCVVVTIKTSISYQMCTFAKPETWWESNALSPQTKDPPAKDETFLGLGSGKKNMHLKKQRRLRHKKGSKV